MLYKALHEAIDSEEEFRKISSAIAELQVKKAILKHNETSNSRKQKPVIVDYNYTITTNFKN